VIFPGDDPDPLSAPPSAPAPGGADDSRARKGAPRDPLGAVAIVLGSIGLVAFGMVMCLVTAWVSAVAGARARDAGRSQENAYLGFGLAALDGVVWIVLHLLFDLNFVAG
jgi:hypothetical protein